MSYIPLAFLTNIVGPQGPKGDTGAASTVAGPQGPAGPASTVAGPKGDTGLTGPASTVAGPQGVKGDTGAASTVAGPQGIQGVPGVGLVRTIYRLATAHTNSTVTPSTIAGAWTHTLVANKTYRFTVFATYQTAALTTGGRMNLLGAGGLAGAVAGMMWGGIVQAAAATTLEVPIFSFANGAGAFLLTTGVSPINSPHVWGADFVFRCTTGGTLSLQWASEVAASAAQLNIGAVMMVEEIE